MIIGIKGRPRSGKTAMGANLMSRYWAYGYFAVSNVDVDFYSLRWPVESMQARPHPLSLKDIEEAFNKGITLNELYKAERIVIYISEFMQYAQARRSNSNTNLLVEFMLSQLGKTNISFIHDEQLGRTVDVIVRDLTEWEYESYKLTYTAEYHGQLYTNALWGFRYVLHDKAAEAKDPNRKPFDFYWPAEDAKPILDSYKTNTFYKSDVLTVKTTQAKEQKEKRVLRF